MGKEGKEDRMKHKMAGGHMMTGKQMSKMMGGKAKKRKTLKRRK